METWDIPSLDLEAHHPQVLQTNEETRAIAINLPAGESMQEHETHEKAFVLVAHGRVEIAGGGGEQVQAGPGFLAHFQPHERREIRAKDDARLVVILAPYPAPGRRS